MRGWRELDAYQNRKCCALLWFVMDLECNRIDERTRRDMINQHLRHVKSNTYSLLYVNGASSKRSRVGTR